MLLQIHFYDFDGTLFRSPVSPSGWPRKRNWWLAPESLNEPCVPERPDSSWWVEETVSDAKRSISDPNVWAVLCTGRSDNSFARYRIPELLQMRGLTFDDVYLSNQNDTPGFKQRVLRGLLSKYLGVEVVHVWEDDEDNIRVLETMTDKAGKDLILHRVKKLPHDALCSAEQLQMASRIAFRWLSRFFR